jgi:hypothetical protein
MRTTLAGTSNVTAVELVAADNANIACNFKSAGQACAISSGLGNMPNYYPLIVRAIGALDENTARTRRMAYERARQALVRHLRAIEPAVRESEVTRERLKLEQAIRKVEEEELESNVSKKALISLARHVETLLDDFEIQQQRDDDGELTKS